MKTALSIIHGPHVPGRIASLARLIHMLQPFPDWLIDWRVHDQRELPRDPTTGYGWAPRAWEWSYNTGAELHVFLNDDVVVCPDFWDVLDAMVQWLPYEAVLGLATVSLAQWEAKHRGDRYLVDGHGVVGWGYALFHHQLEWLHRTERMLSFDHRSPHSHDECAPDCPYWHEDSWATKLFHENAYQVWHPIPSILDHDTSIPSAYAHENHKTRRAPVTWWAYDSEQLTSPSFWRPQLGLVPPMQTRKIPCRYGAFHVPAEPLHRTVGSELTCLHVFLGEYEYERPGSEPVETMVDVGCNVGASIVWAQQWWPSLKRIDGYDPNVDALEFAHINVQNCAHSADVKLHHLAVTVDQHPLFKEHDDWGGSRTHGETTGVRVNGIHPRDLPAADVLKCDAEGVDGDVFEHYQHWSGVEVAMFEYHTAADRERMVRVVTEAGLTMVKHRPDSDTQGVMIWVRR